MVAEEWKVGRVRGNLNKRKEAVEWGKSSFGRNMLEKEQVVSKGAIMRVGRGKIEAMIKKSRAKGLVPIPAANGSEDFTAIPEHAASYVEELRALGLQVFVTRPVANSKGEPSRVGIVTYDALEWVRVMGQSMVCGCSDEE